MKTLVTGATGFLGNHVARLLAERGEGGSSFEPNLTPLGEENETGKAGKVDWFGGEESNIGPRGEPPP